MSHLSAVLGGSFLFNFLQLDCNFSQLRYSPEEVHGFSLAKENQTNVDWPIEGPNKQCMKITERHEKQDSTVKAIHESWGQFGFYLI